MKLLAIFMALMCLSGCSTGQNEIIQVDDEIAESYLESIINPVINEEYHARHDEIVALHDGTALDYFKKNDEIIEVEKTRTSELLSEKFNATYLIGNVSENYGVYRFTGVFDVDSEDRITVPYRVFLDITYDGDSKKVTSLEVDTYARP